MASGSRAGFTATLNRALEREQARKDGDYAKADAIRQELTAQGVRCDDGSHTFTTPDGHQGSYSLHKGIGFQEVQMMCLEREEMRRENKYGEADQIRQQIQGHGATLDDKTHIFRMPDGSQGSYDLYKGTSSVAALAAPQPTRGYAFVNVRTAPIIAAAPAVAHYAAPVGTARRAPIVHAAPPVVATVQRQAPMAAQFAAPQRLQVPRLSQLAAPQPQRMQVARVSQPAPPMRSPVPMLGSGAVGGGGGGVGVSRSEGGKFRGYLDALKLATEREEFRKSRDYNGADRLRSLLQQSGVAVNDQNHTFSVNGLEGSYDLNAGFSSREIQYVALEREESRRDRDYARGDSLRDWLSKQNVTLDDKTHTFTMANGEVGSYDLYNWAPTDDLASFEPPHKQPRR